MHQITILIITWNSRRYLPECLRSIFAQTCRDFQVLIIDNNSQDGTVEYLRSNYPQVALIKNSRNLGFARANNQGIQLTQSPYVVLCNPDIILSTDWLAEIMSEVDRPANGSVAGFGGRLLKLKLTENNEVLEWEKTEIIDSAGFKILSNHQAVELGAGEPMSKYNVKEEVFGHSGALVLFRRAALQDVKMQAPRQLLEDYFDSDFFFYKEDVDLAWRLQLLGWRSLLVPAALAYHLRALSGSEHQNLRQILARKKSQSALAKYYSYRNHFLVLLKNEFASNYFYYLVPILFYELKKFFYNLLFDVKNLPALGEVLVRLKKIRRDRREIFSRAKVDAKYIRGWISKN